MKLLLINKNPIVRKLVKLSAEKAGIEAIEAEALGEVSEAAFDFVFIDDESLDDAPLGEVQERFPEAKCGFIHAKDREREAGFALFVQKPFLPTDMVDLLKAETQGSQPHDFIQESTPSVSADKGDGDLGEDFLADLEDEGQSGMEVDNPLADLDGEILDLGEESDGEAQEALEMKDGDLDFDLDLEELEGGEKGVDSLEAMEELAPMEEEMPEEDMALQEESEAVASVEALGADVESEELDLTLDDLEMPEEEASTVEEKEAEVAGAESDTEEESEAIEKPEALGDLEWDGSLLDDVALVASEPASEDLGVDLGSMEFSNEEESVLEEEESAPVEEALGEGGVLDSEEVEAVKNLLQEGDLPPVDSEDLDMNEIKIESSELASLTEEALSEALGEELEVGEAEIDFDAETLNIEADAEGLDLALEESADEESAENLEEESPLPAEELEIEESPLSSEAPAPKPASEAIAESAPVASAPLEAVKSLQGLSIPALKELLDGMQLTISISFPNKK